ncbi:hypothetical protein HMN09_00570000 [Mycena chlorophos]|uniref:Uncharacterized protein n=1 Tax=Mycena chlorophos TaxID=658473 RepID=A0A8H6WJ15_MYCCL|nr:hypothetical protein HMN09_00570000 [Mycena chlorophos]
MEDTLSRQSEASSYRIPVNTVEHMTHQPLSFAIIYMAASLPQELIDAILWHIVDAATLKSCSLTASPFLATSQRALLHYLRLDDANAERVSALLNDSPHLAHYVTHLRLMLPQAHTTEADHRMLGIVLARLANIRVVVADGEPSWDTYRWADIPALFLDALWSFLEQPNGSLEVLHLHNVQNIPEAPFRRLLFTVPALELYHVSIDPDDQLSGPGVDTEPTGGPRLAFHQHTIDNFHALAPKGTLRGVQHLTIRFQSFLHDIGTTMRGLASSEIATSLASLQLQSHHPLRTAPDPAQSALLSRTCFPALRELQLVILPSTTFIELSLCIHVQPFLTLLSAEMPALEKAILGIFLPSSAELPQRYAEKWTLDEEFLKDMDDALDAAAVAVEWRLQHGLGSQSLVDSIGAHMPKARERGMLRVISDSPLDAKDRWASLRGYSLPYRVYI